MHTTDHEQSAHLHAHRAGDASHHHFTEANNSKALAWALWLTLTFAGVEVATGFWSNSLALLSDAGHMVTDASALGLALLAQLIARRPPSVKHSFGFGRAEALAGFINALIMLAVIAWIAYEAILRLSNPKPVKGDTVFAVALLGLFVNMVVALLLSQDSSNVNMRAALIHVLGDMLGSVAAIVAGGVIHFTGWLPVDPILSMVVSLLILKSTIAVLRDSYHFLMEGVPHHIDYLQVGSDLSAVAGVLSVHDLHVWEMTPGQPALIGHMEIDDLESWPTVLRDVKAMLLERYRIDHVTLQPETPGMAKA